MKNISLALAALLASAFLFPASAQVFTNATKLRGKNVCPAAPTDGQALVWNATTGCWVPGTASGSGGAPTGAAGGGLAGTYPDPTLALPNAAGGPVVLDGSGNAVIGTTVPCQPGDTSADCASLFRGDASGLYNLLQPSFSKAYVSWNAGTIANGACTSQTFTLLNSVVGDWIVPGWPALNAGVIGIMRVSANDTIEVRICNLSGSSATVATLTYAAMNIK